VAFANAVGYTRNNEPILTSYSAIIRMKFEIAQVMQNITVIHSVSPHILSYYEF
jgi:hypothetical protein